MNPDGSDVTHIIDEYAENVQFTPDGTRIIMNKGNSGIWSVKIDGSDLNQIITFSVNTEPPTISSENMKIAFSNGDVYVMDNDGTNLQNLTNTPDIEERYPHFSFDGSKIVFTCRQDSINSINIMESNGENKIEVLSTNTTKYFIYRYPIFDEDSDTIFYKYLNYPQDGLYSIKNDGTNNNLIIEGFMLYYNFPSISSDGNNIVFCESNDIYIMNGDGTNISVLTEGYYPIISSDGEKIVFSCGEIRIINSDGSGLNVLDEGWNPRFSKSNKKIVYIKERQIDKNQNKGIVF
jgi:Tol biopolymer transport system component